MELFLVPTPYHRRQRWVKSRTASLFTILTYEEYRATLSRFGIGYVPHFLAWKDENTLSRLETGEAYWIAASLLTQARLPHSPKAIREFIGLHHDLYESLLSINEFFEKLYHTPLPTTFLTHEWEQTTQLFSLLQPIFEQFNQQLQNDHLCTSAQALFSAIKAIQQHQWPPAWSEVTQLHVLVTPTLTEADIQFWIACAHRHIPVQLHIYHNEASPLLRSTMHWLLHQLERLGDDISSYIQIHYLPDHPTENSWWGEKWFSQHTWNPISSDNTASLLLPDNVHISILGDPLEEAYVVANRVQSILLQGESVGLISIAKNISNEFFAQAFAEHGINLPHDITLAEGHLGKALLSCIELFQRQWPWQETMTLFMNPILKDSLSYDTASALLDLCRTHKIAPYPDEVLAYTTSDPQSWKQFNPDPECTWWSTLWRWQNYWPTHASLTQWMHLTKEWLHNEVDPVSLQDAADFTLIFQLLHLHDDISQQSIDVSTWILWLKNVLEHHRSASSVIGHPHIYIGDLNQLAAAHVDHVFIVQNTQSVTQPRFSILLRDDFLHHIHRVLQKHIFNIPSDIGNLWSLWTLSASTHISLYLSASRLDIHGREMNLLPSMLTYQNSLQVRDSLDLFDVQNTEIRNTWISQQLNIKNPSITHMSQRYVDRYLWNQWRLRQQSQTEFAHIHTLPIPDDSIIFTHRLSTALFEKWLPQFLGLSPTSKISSTVLESLAQCPLQTALYAIHPVKNITQTPLMDAATIGIAIHKVLEILYDQIRSDALELMLQQLENIFETVWKDLCTQHSLWIRDAFHNTEKYYWKNQCRRTLIALHAHAPQNPLLRRCEMTFTGDGNSTSTLTMRYPAIPVQLPSPNKVDTIFVGGQIDRVDIFSDRVIIYDYKTSKKSTLDAKRAGAAQGKTSFQLPLYALMVQEALKNDPLYQNASHSISAHFVSIRFAEVLPNVLQDPQYSTITLDSVKNILTPLRQGFLNPQGTTETCERCSHRLACGIYNVQLNKTISRRIL